MIFILVVVVIVAFDQVTKYYADKELEVNEVREVVKDKIYFANVRNEGAFFGIFKNNKLFLNIVSLFSITLIGFMFLKSIAENINIGTKLALSFIFGGGIGNILDRFRKKYVTDFICFKSKHSPVFNIADIFVFIGSIILLLVSFFSTDNS